MEVVLLSRPEDCGRVVADAVAGSVLGAQARGGPVVLGLATGSSPPLAYDRAEQTVRAGEADRDTGPLLGLPAGRPVLVFDRVSYSAGRPVEHAESTYRGDRYELSMTVETGAG